MYLFKSLHVYNYLCLFLSISIDSRVSFNICLNIFLSDSLSLYTYIYIHTVFYFFIISYFYFYIHINIYIEFLSKFTKYQSLSVCIYICTVCGRIDFESLNCCGLNPCIAWSARWWSVDKDRTPMAVSKGDYPLAGRERFGGFFGTYIKSFQTTW